MGVAIYAYRVSPLDPKKAKPLETLLEHIHKKPLDSRIRLIGEAEIRLESLEKTDEGYYLMDFTRLRFEHGPGRASRNEAITGFKFKTGEGFGEETGALYDPKTSHIVVQYNHFGVRAGRIAEYFCSINDKPDDAYDLHPRFDDEIERKLARKQIFRAFEFKIAARQMSKSDKQGGMSLSTAVSLGEGFGAETITVHLSASRGKRGSSLNGNTIQKALTALRSRLGIDTHSVEAIKITGKDDPDSKSEVLNLLGHRLKVEFNDLQLDDDLRYPRDQRWYALRRAYNGWHSTFKKK